MLTLRTGGMYRALCPTMVGRSEHLEVLNDALADAGAGEGQLVVVGGSAGIGKTRLAIELQRQALAAGTLVLAGSCSHIELSLPYLPFLEAIGNYFSLADLAQVRTLVGPAARELAHLFPQLGIQPATHTGDPSQAKLRLFEAFFALFSALSRPQRLLIVIEDLHSADSASLELLDYLGRRLRVEPVMLLVTYRGEEIDRQHHLHAVLESWRRKGTVRFLELGPLSPGNVAEMVQAIFEVESIGDDLRDLLYRRSEGNPFVLEELLKAALDQGYIVRSETGWSRPDLASITLPATIRDMILLRFERLPAGAADPLRIAAVIGE